MNIKAAATTLCLVTLVACSERKEESAWAPTTVPESNATQLEQDADGHGDVVETGPGPEIEDHVSDTRVDISDVIEPSAPNDYESEQLEVSVAPSTHSIEEKAVTEDNVVSSTVEETKVSATYTVKRGDTLSAIANSYNVTLSAIVAKNNLTDRDSIRIGQQLVIE